MRLFGNIFDNTRLHCVTCGAPRTSYVLRLVKKNSVKLTRASVTDGVARSTACHVFSSLLKVTQDAELDVKDVDWACIFVGDDLDRHTN
jgi:hypothetical protein